MKLSPLELEKVFLEAHEIALKFFKSDTLQIENKADLSPVTQADHALNEYFLKTLTQIIPGSAVLGEEGSTGIHDQALPRYCWILDPIDGTKEFISGTDEWAVQLCLYEKNEGCLLSILSQPTRNLFSYAQKGKGAFTKDLSTGNTTQLKASQKSSSLEATLLASKSRKDTWTESIIKNHPFKNTNSVGSIGLKGLEIASGRADFYMNGDQKCGAWDIFPCLPFLIESGANYWTSKDLNWKEEIKNKNIQAHFAFGTKGLIQNMKADLAKSVSSIA
ncbi:MAG: inositol monophosphatase family protein [bacterium]